MANGLTCVRWLNGEEELILEFWLDYNLRFANKRDGKANQTIDYGCLRLVAILAHPLALPLDTIRLDTLG